MKAAIINYSRPSSQQADSKPVTKQVETSSASATINKILHPDQKTVQDALKFLAHTALAVSADILGSHPVGKLVVVILQGIFDRSNDAGAAARSCELLKQQVRLVTVVMARALADERLEPEAARIIREELCGVLEAARRLIGRWEGRGSLQQFLTGNAADEEFRAVHQQLAQCYQHVALAWAMLKTSGPRPPPPPVASDTEAQAITRPPDYREVTASKAAYERLLLLFALVYKPGPTAGGAPPTDADGKGGDVGAGRQERRLLELLQSLNCDRKLRLLPVLNEDRRGEEVRIGGPPGPGGTAGKIEVIAGRLCGVVDGWADERDKAALEGALASIVGAVWRRREALPDSRLGKMRVAVYEALGPLRKATGRLMLPQAPPCPPAPAAAAE